MIEKMIDDSLMGVSRKVRESSQTQKAGGKPEKKPAAKTEAAKKEDLKEYL